MLAGTSCETRLRPFGSEARGRGETELTVAISEAPHIWGLAASHQLRRVGRRLRAGPVFRWRFSGFAPDRLLLAPPDLRIADPEIAKEFYAGQFVLDGHAVETGGLSPFQVRSPDADWETALNGFRWLRHLRGAGTELAASNARALVLDWIDLHGRSMRGVAWEPDVTSRRIIAWLQHSNLVLAGADMAVCRRFLRSLAFQVRYLKTIAAAVEDDEERLRARMALAFASLALPGSPAATRMAARHLERELQLQILADGGHVSRNPMVLLSLLTDLMPLRQTYANSSGHPPMALIEAVERMLPALRFFRHQDGNLALFNGAAATKPERIEAVLRHDETGGAPLRHAAHSGYERLVMGGTTVIADTGLPPPPASSRDAHAGCLAFEMSSGRHRYIVNTGVDRFGPADFRALSRATAAHSTATIDDTSSCRFSNGRGVAGMCGTPIIAGPTHVDIEHIDHADAHGFVASHDGYVRAFGIYHERQLVLSSRGSVIEGVDRFFAHGRHRLPERRSDHVVVRFHLHPAVTVEANSDGFLNLRAGEDDVWAFTCDELRSEVDNSIYFAGPCGPLRTHQIILSFRAAAFPEVHWRLTRVRLGA